MKTDKYYYRLSIWCSNCKEYHEGIGNNIKLQKIYNGYSIDNCTKKLLKALKDQHEFENNVNYTKPLRVFYYKNDEKITEAQYFKELKIKQD